MIQDPQRITQCKTRKWRKQSIITVISLVCTYYTDREIETCKQRNRDNRLGGYGNKKQIFFTLIQDSQGMKQENEEKQTI